MISSISNPRIKNIITLMKKSRARDEQGLFLVEGIKMFQELPKDRIHSVYVSEGFLKRNSHKLLLEGTGYELVSDDVFSHMSDTKSPQGILALVKQFSYSLEDLLVPVKKNLLILDRIQDPGNLGTLIRTGEGAGISGVIMSCGTADIYNPKVIRSTMGSVYRVPFFYTDQLSVVLEELEQHGVTLYAAHLKADRNYDQMDYTHSCGFLIGNEANGLADEISDFAKHYIKIPMEGKVESLNAAVAASVLMFEVARQRRDTV